MAYANETRVPVTQTQSEIKQLLLKNKATSFVLGENPTSAVVMFEMHARRIKFTLPIPIQGKIKDRKGHLITSAAKIAQLERSRWRALLLTIKAKLEATEIGITTFEDEFMAHIVLPDGQTVGNWMKPQLEQSYTKAKMPPLLGFGGQ